jgi:hypothetical protein
MSPLSQADVYHERMPAYNWGGIVCFASTSKRHGGRVSIHSSIDSVTDDARSVDNCVHLHGTDLQDLSSLSATLAKPSAPTFDHDQFECAIKLFPGDARGSPLPLVATRPGREYWYPFHGSSQQCTVVTSLLRLAITLANCFRSIRHPSDQAVEAFQCEPLAFTLKRWAPTGAQYVCLPGPQKSSECQ